MNVNKFLDNFYGGARNDLFEVWIGYPRNAEFIAGLTALNATLGTVQAVAANPTKAANTKADQLLDISTGGSSRYLAKSAKLPSSKVASAEVNYKGRKFAYPTTQDMERTMSVGFYNDIHFGQRNFFEYWIQFMRTTQTNVGHYPDDCFAEMKVYQHDVKGNILKAYKFINVFPTSVSEIALDWGSEGIEEFTVDFQFHYWLTDTTS